VSLPQLLVTADAVPCSLILSSLMIEAIISTGMLKFLYLKEPYGVTTHQTPFLRGL
jgi:hypothetical protein